MMPSVLKLIQMKKLCIFQPLKYITQYLSDLRNLTDPEILYKIRTTMSSEAKW